ncbi:zinc c2h2 finger domain containing protein [Ophiostoma piceae UAMH 11346]|uniref:Zinc c2h2 finger domain containing protein n=1 Tax=Ophiostoma piceae (strain UAMH 11346) TaxID=1262450 RepID=S3BWK1_OPHP1|nr:zinc c2h2 finger domain containing protein [Ophiostoma piceae UAMH 11346]
MLRQPITARVPYKKASAAPLSGGSTVEAQHPSVRLCLTVYTVVSIYAAVSSPRLHPEDRPPVEMDEPNSGQNGHGLSSYPYQPNPEMRVQDFYLSQVDPFSLVQPLPPSTILPSELEAAPQPAPRSDYDGTQELGDSTYGTNSGGKQWQPPSQSLYDGTVSSMSTVGALAAGMSRLQVPYAQSEAGVHPRQPGGRQKRRRLSRPLTADTQISTAGPGAVNDAHSTGVASSHGEDILAHKHINTHIKPFKCSSPLCKQYTRGFATTSDLERHENTHTDSRNLSQSYVCKHGKCRTKEKLWKRWDNLKTHIRDVHSITQVSKEDYLKKHNRTHDQDLAGMVPAASPIVPGGSILEDINNEIMVTGGSNTSFQYPLPQTEPQTNTKQYIDELSQIVKNTSQRRTVPSLEMPHPGNSSTTTTAPLVHYATPSSLFNNQEQTGLYLASFQQLGTYSGNFNMLPDAGRSIQNKSVEGAGGDIYGSGIINISDDDDPPDDQNETISHPKSPTSHRVSFAEPPSTAIDEPQAAHNDEDDDKDGKDDGNEEEIELGVPNEDISQPVLRPGTTPTTDVEQLLHNIKNYSSQDMKKFLEGINQMDALKSLGYEIRAPAQSSTHSHSVRSAQTGPSEVGDGKMHQCRTHGCGASFLSSSGLKKHETRHMRPFGCTHGCKADDKPRTFGSKNDWKRHEESVHFSKDLPIMTWKCDETTEDNAACGKVYQTSSLFQRHLIEHHGVKDKNKKMMERMAKNRFIPAKEASYWCGFCRLTLTDPTDTPVAAAAAAAAAAATSASSSTASTASAASTAPTILYSLLMTSRFNHIDNHFAGRNCLQTSIDQWVTKVQHQERVEALRLTSQYQPGPSRPAGSRKRPAPREQPDSHDSAHEDKPKTTNVYWICCRCGGMSARINSDSCNDCGVRVCVNCEEFERDPGP